MDSLNLFKGYGHIEDKSLQKPSTKPRRRVIAAAVAVAVAAALLLALAAAAAAGFVSRDSATISADTAIQIVCSVTPRPDSCYAAISASGPPPLIPDPQSVLGLALRASRAEIANLSSSLESLAGSGEASVRDCRDLVDDALGRAGDAEVGAGGELTERRLKDLSTWLSAALTDHDTCLEGLEETGSEVLDWVRGRMVKSKEYTSNALAIVANFHVILDKFDELKKL